MKIKLCLIALLLLFVRAAAAQLASVDWEHDVDFSKYQALTWATAANPDDTWNQRVAGYLGAEIAAKGLAMVDAQQPFQGYLSYEATTHADPENLDRQQITVSVLISDAATTEVVWRATGALPLSGSDEQDTASVRSLVAAMLAQYPPARRNE